MAQVVNSGSSVKVKDDAKRNARKGQAGRAIGGSVGPDHDTVDVCFDLDGEVEAVKTEDLVVLGT